MIADPTLIYDGFASLAGGVDGGRRPDEIGENQCESGENLVFRGGIPRSRPGIRDLTHQFQNTLYYDTHGVYSTGAVTGQGSATRFAAGKFQGASYYAPRVDFECLMAMIDGGCSRSCRRRGTNSRSRRSRWRSATARARPRRT
jgi:hypothetical protein